VALAVHRFHVLLEVVHARKGLAAERAGHVLRVVEVHELDVAPGVVRLFALVLAQRTPEHSHTGFPKANTKRYFYYKLLAIIQQCTGSVGLGHPPEAVLRIRDTLSRIRTFLILDPNFFIPDAGYRILHEKWDSNLVVVKKIRDQRSGKKSRIRILGGKTPDPQHCSFRMLKFVPQNQILVPFRIMVFSLKKIASKI
jgi:hypothetical protein